MERRLDPASFDAYVSAPMSAAERDEILSLVAWFTRRHRTAGERLAASRCAMKNAVKLREAASARR